MCSRFLKVLLFCGCLTVEGLEEQQPLPPSRLLLRVAADPNNLPFSNDKLEGYENKLASLIARDFEMELQYVWRAQRRGFFRETLKNGQADLVLSVPAGFEMALTTRPYYRSSYVFVYPRSHSAIISTFDDPYLRRARIGVQLTGDDGVNPPPAHAFAQRGIITNLVGYTLYGDYREANPPARIIDGLDRGEIDLAVVWGPLAGYFAQRAAIPMQLTPVIPSSEPPLRYAFNISMAVPKRASALQARLNDLIQRRHAEIEALLDEFAIPRLPLEPDQDRTEKD